MTTAIRAFGPVVLALLVALSGCGAVGTGLLSGGTPTAGPGAGTDTPGGGSGTPTATPAVPTPGPDAGTLVTVVGVVSADTLTVEYDNGSRATVGLAGVATPQTDGGNDPGAYETVPDVASAEECLAGAGEDAVSRTRSELRGQEVTIVVAPNGTADGDATPVYAFVDGTLYNLQLLRDGDARVDGDEVRYHDAFATAEAAARDAGRGLWRCADVETPTPSVTSTATATPTPVSETGLRVVEVSDEGEELNDEYIVVENTGDRLLDLAGWRVRDGDGHTYTFKDGTTLEPGESLTLYTGAGSQTETERYWWNDEEIWDDDGETITVYNDNGDKVYRRTYS